MIRAGLHNFSKGEIAPELWGRIDVPAYNAAVRLARNVVILTYGGLQRRMGSRVAYEIREPEAGWDDASAAARLVPFEYSIEQSYVLLLTQAEMRPLAFGGAVLEEELDITGISLEDGAIIEAANHDYSEGDEVFLTGIEGALGNMLNDQVWPVIEDIDDDHFRIDADTTGLAAFTGSEGGIVRADPPPPPPPPPPVPAPYVPPPQPYYWSPGNYYWYRDGVEGYYEQPL